MKRQIRNLLIASMALSVPALAQAQDDYDRYGVPTNVNNIGIDPNLLEVVDRALPERSAVNEDFLNHDYNPNLRLSDDSHVGVTFVSEGAGYRNSLGYFSFQDDSFDGLSFGDIDTNGNGNIGLNELGAVNGVDVGLVFANSSAAGSGGALQAGDSIGLGGGTVSAIGGNDIAIKGGTTFSAGTNIGFFVAANAWNGSGVRGYDAAGEANNYFTMDFLNPENSSTATIDNAGDYSRHVGMMFATVEKDAIVMGFEDLRRPWGDNDFNDAVFIVRADPAAALADNEITVHAAPAPQAGAGALGLLALSALGFVRRKRSA